MTSNFNLFFSLIGAATIAFLGVVVFMHNRKSATSKIFFVHTLIITFWSIANYFSLSVSPDHALFWIRAVIFLAVPHVFLFFLFVQNFPKEKIEVSKKLFSVSFIVMILMLLLASSNYAFKSIEIRNGNVVPVAGALMPAYGIVLVLFSIFTFGLIIKKYAQSDRVTKKQWLTIGIGLFSAYTLLVFLVFVRVAAHGDTRFVLYSPLFVLPIFIGAAYAILKHHLFNIKVIATETLTFVLLLASFVQLFLSENSLAKAINVVVIIFLLYFGILLIKSVLKEVEQREELAKFNIELRKAKLELEKLSQFKSQMLRLASHQIKAPLATIKGFASIIIEGLYGPVSDKIKDTVIKMKDSSDELIKLINDLLDLSKVEQGRMEYKFETVKFKDLVQGVFDGLKIQADAKKLQFSLIPGPDVNVNADPQKLKQVLANLVENAIKYTPKGFVKVESKEENGFIVFSVSDSGLGIGPNLLPHLFDQEFVRDERVKREVKGTGLGLYIAKSIVTAHGGTIWAESPGENKGSSFFVKIRKV